jgi:hypothetical protein
MLLFKSYLDVSVNLKRRARALLSKYGLYFCKKFILHRSSLRDSVTKFVALGFFHESPSPKPLIITFLGSFQIFSKIRGDSQVKVHHRCQQHRRQIAAGINDTGGKFATGINDTGGKFCHREFSKNFETVLIELWNTLGLGGN